MTEQINNALSIVPPPFIPGTLRRLGSVEYVPEFCQLVVDAMNEGESLVQVAAKIGVHRRTLDRWRERHSEFDEAMSFGEMLSQAWWESKAMKNLENKTFKEALWFMNMRNRFSWTNSDDAAKKGAPPLLIMATNLSIAPASQDGDSYVLEITGEPVGESGLKDESISKAD